MIRVVAIVTAKPGRRDELLTKFHALIPIVHAEQGCIEYQPTIDAEGFGASQAKLGPNKFVVIESWADADALKAHGVAPHMAAYRLETKELTESVVVHMLAPA
jgi:quinol monooxygenase YgiN